MERALLAASAHPGLAGAVAGALGEELLPCQSARHPDGELAVRVDERVRGRDAYLLGPLGPPVEASLLELLLIADACRRAGAARVTGLVPYLGYARGDRRGAGGEPLAARLVADLLGARLDRVVAVDLHQPAAEGFFGVPLEHLSAVPLLAEAVRDRAARAVVVSPDLGAAKLAERFAGILGLPVAGVHKERLGGGSVRALAVRGEVRGLSPLVVDDMVCTGATVEAAVGAILEAGARPEVTVVATHALLVGGARERLARLPVTRLVATDSLPVVPGALLPLRLVPLAPLLAEAVRRLSGERPLGDLLSR